MKSWVVRATDPKTVGEIVQHAGESVEAIDEGRVFVGKKRAKSARDPVKPGDEVRIGKPDGATADVPILFSGNDFVAVAKPAGIPTVPDHHGSAHSLVGVVARVLKKKPADLRVTSRLDREVSGAVVFALSDAAEARLKHARARGEYARRYVAIGLIDVDYIDRVINVDQRIGAWTAAIDGKPSETRFRVVSEGAGSRAVMLAVDPQTGRTHQIRIHASGAGMPLFGDREHGGVAQTTMPNGRIVGIGRIALHAARVAVAGIEAVAPIPDELARVWSELGGPADAWDDALRD